MITICLTYFRSLTLANLRAALYSVSRQNFDRVDRVVIVDNNTDDSIVDVQQTVRGFDLPVKTDVYCFKHGDQRRSHAWSTNEAVKLSDTPWIFFTRADYLIDFTMVEKFAAIVDAQPPNWRGFVTSRGRHLHQTVEACESAEWRRDGPGMFPGIDFNYTCIDTGVWMTSRTLFREVGGLDERLSAWGHAQTHFQYKLHSAGTECVCVNETLFFHPAHGAERNIVQATAELKAIGVDVRDLWSRSEGPSPYQ